MRGLGEPCLELLLLRYRVPKSIARARYQNAQAQYRKPVRPPSPSPRRSGRRECRDMFGTTPKRVVPRPLPQIRAAGSIYAEPRIDLKNLLPWAENGVHRIGRLSPKKPAERDCRVRSSEDVEKHRCAAVAISDAEVREGLIRIGAPVGEHFLPDGAHVRLRPASLLADLAYELPHVDGRIGSYNAPGRSHRIDRQHGRRARRKAARHRARDTPKIPSTGSQGRSVDGRVRIAAGDRKPTNHGGVGDFKPDRADGKGIRMRQRCAVLVPLGAVERPSLCTAIGCGDNCVLAAPERWESKSANTWYARDRTCDADSTFHRADRVLKGVLIKNASGPL